MYPPVPTFEQLAAALDNLETTAMLAGLSQKLVTLHSDALFTMRDGLASVNNPPPDDPEVSSARSEMMFAADHIAGQTTKLLVDATWHPILGTLPLVAHSAALPSQRNSTPPRSRPAWHTALGTEDHPRVKGEAS